MLMMVNALFPSRLVSDLMIWSKQKLQNDQPTNLLTHLALALALGSLISTVPDSAVARSPSSHLGPGKGKGGGCLLVMLCYTMQYYAIYPPRSHPSLPPSVYVPIACVPILVYPSLTYISRYILRSAGRHALLFLDKIRSSSASSSSSSS
jgi:hypothetical protein